MQKEVTLHIDTFKEGDTYIAYCPTLDLSSCGSTEAEAIKMFEKAAQLFFEELEEMGTKDQMLSEMGWKKSAQSWIPPKIAERDLRVALPS